MRGWVGEEGERGGVRESRRYWLGQRRTLGELHFLSSLVVLVSPTTGTHGSPVHAGDRYTVGALGGGRNVGERARGVRRGDVLRGGV